MDFEIPMLPYSLLVGQEMLKLALELAYIAPRLGGVLLSGQRGTGKSTAVRSFAKMIYGDLPITLPINATEDRVVGGLDIDKLMQSDARWKDGLLVEAKDKLLYVDEINLLDDHIVNIILDVTSTGKLEVQRDGQSVREDVAFTLVGTMNPEEGGLRPQLLDRFGLMVNVKTATTKEERLAILENVLKFEDEWEKKQKKENSDFLEQAQQADDAKRAALELASKRFFEVDVSPALKQCVALAEAFEIEGNRGERVLAMAARAHAALHDRLTVTIDDLRIIAPLAFQHRRMGMEQNPEANWTTQDAQDLEQVLSRESGA
ncbi:MAG: AAA domain-containing protein [Cyanothece sp. SIO1E1]|nr:AAA domain-containing protein [Cyanothece sp. SIO1E1]